MVVHNERITDYLTRNSFVSFVGLDTAGRIASRTDALGVTTTTHTDDGRVDLESTVFGAPFPQLGGGQNLVVNPSYDVSVMPGTGSQVSTSI